MGGGRIKTVWAVLRKKAEVVEAMTANLVLDRYSGVNPRVINWFQSVPC